MPGVVTNVPVRFSDCDPAGIAYYPALFALCDAAIEAWTGEAIGVSRKIMHQEMGLALPTVSMRAEFAKVVEWGDDLAITIETRRVGTSSVGIEAIASCGGERRFAVSYTQVLMCMEEHKARPWPEEWRERLEQEIGR